MEHTEFQVFRRIRDDLKPRPDAGWKSFLRTSRQTPERKLTDCRSAKN